MKINFIDRNEIPVRRNTSTHVIISTINSINSTSLAFNSLEYRRMKYKYNYVKYYIVLYFLYNSD